MKNSAHGNNRKLTFALVGLALGVGAPITWTIIRLLCFSAPNTPLADLLLSDITKSVENMALYAFMGIGTALVMATLGFIIGKRSDELQQRAGELDELHREVASQKEIFENRYKVLDSNIKSFHQISSRIQKSIDIAEVIALSAEGLHDILGYERVNILMLDDGQRNLRFVAVKGTEDFDPASVVIPLDERSGAIYKSFVDKKVYLVDDITRYPSDYHLQSPCNTLAPLRSTSFIVCPIIMKGESVGVFGIDNKFTGRRLNDTDIDTIKLFADQVASAINRINLLQAIDTLIIELEKSFTDILSKRSDYNRNIFNLEGSVDALTGNTGNIASASESVLRSVDETSAAVGDISVAIDQVTRNLDALTESVYKSASAMEEINASLKNVEQSAAISHKVSSQVKGQADHGRTVVDNTISALDEIQDAVDLSYAGIKRLSENSSRIESIVNVINDITKRTNLLALNASIIAAQAGEYGKSFGVVADEIRNLSLQTGQSTGEITGIIEEIMSESRSAANNVTLTKELVQRGVGLGQKTGEALQVIIESASQAMDMTEEIKIATEEQTKSVQLVTQSIEDVSTMTSQIFNVSKEQANATKSIGHAIESIKRMTQEMVNATTRQVQGGKEIKDSVDMVGNMVVNIIANLEKRKDESSSVVHEMEVMREHAG
jgi:methyl-accepting chemotaxis protein